MKKVLIVVAIGIFYVGSLFVAVVAGAVIQDNYTQTTPQTPQSTPQITTIKSVTPETVSKLYMLVDEYRNELGLAELDVSPKLERSAKMKAIDMVTLGYWSHQSPEGQEPWELLKFVGYSYEKAGENLARDYTDADSIMKAWKESPSHNDTLVNKYYRQQGIGFSCGSDSGGCVVVHHFAQPAYF